MVCHARPHGRWPWPPPGARAPAVRGRRPPPRLAPPHGGPHGGVRGRAPHEGLLPAGGRPPLPDGPGPPRDQGRVEGPAPGREGRRHPCPGAHPPAVWHAHAPRTPGGLHPWRREPRWPRQPARCGRGAFGVAPRGLDPGPRGGAHGRQRRAAPGRQHHGAPGRRPRLDGLRTRAGGPRQGAGARVKHHRPCALGVQRWPHPVRRARPAPRTSRAPAWRGSAAAPRPPRPGADRPPTPGRGPGGPGPRPRRPPRGRAAPPRPVCQDTAGQPSPGPPRCGPDPSLEARGPPAPLLTGGRGGPGEPRYGGVGGAGGSGAAGVGGRASPSPQAHGGVYGRPAHGVGAAEGSRRGAGGAAGLGGRARSPGPASRRMTNSHTRALCARW
jgi:hypothetical protein